MESLWKILKSAVSQFLGDAMLSRGAAIAYYTVFALAPVLVIVIAVAGLVFGTEAAQSAIIAQVAGLVGEKAADLVRTMLQAAENRDAGVWATVISTGALVLTASGVFGELQTSLNVIWKSEPRSGLSRLVRARLASLGLVVALGFLLLVSLVVNAGLTATGNYLNDLFPGGHVVLQVTHLVVSLALIALLFAAIFKVLPDRLIAWRDVIMGGIATAVLFTLGKTLIGFYLGLSTIASGFGAAGALALVLIWIYYSAQIFLFGATFTRAYAELHGRFAAPQPRDHLAERSVPTGKRPSEKA
jgi:membrane protein